MNQQWPLGEAGEAADQPLLPLAFHEQVELIRAGAALDAFARKRAVQIVTHGHTPENDRERAIGALACEAKARLNALTEVVGGYEGRMNLPPERREQCLRYIEIAAGIMIALWDRCQVEVPEQ